MQYIRWGQVITSRSFYSWHHSIFNTRRWELFEVNHSYRLKLKPQPIKNFKNYKTHTVYIDTHFSLIMFQSQQRSTYKHTQTMKCVNDGASIDNGGLETKEELRCDDVYFDWLFVLIDLPLLFIQFSSNSFSFEFFILFFSSNGFLQFYSDFCLSCGWKIFRIFLLVSRTFLINAVINIFNVF